MALFRMSLLSVLCCCCCRECAVLMYGLCNVVPLAVDFGGGELCIFACGGCVVWRRCVWSVCCCDVTYGVVMTFGCCCISVCDVVEVPSGLGVS